MPQVDAVGALSQPYEGLNAEETSKVTMGLCARSNDHEREKRGNENSPIVGEGTVAVRERHEHQEAREPQNS